MTEVRNKILFLRDVKKLSFRQIADKVGINRKTVSKIYQGKDVRVKRISYLEKYRPLVSQWFKEYPNLKAHQVFSWLKERDENISYPRVVQYTKPFRKKKQTAFHHLNFLPGEEAQVDWAVITLPQLGKLYCFVLILSYSRYLFAHVFKRSSFEFFIEGHLMAFKNMNGTAHSLRYDNLKSVVLKRNPEIQYNPRFLDFSRHFGIDIYLCNPGAGNEKGRVERAIRTIKENVFDTTKNYSSLNAINRNLHEWVNEKNSANHRATGQKPVDLFKEEKLKPLPAIFYQNVTIHTPVKTTKTAMMTFDTNSYSVPEYLTGESLSIYSSCNLINIYHNNKKIASHPRSFKRYQKIINPIHRTYLKLSSKAKMDRIYEVIKNMHPAIEEFLLKNDICAEDPRETAYQIFKQLKTNSRSLIISAIQESIVRKSPRVRTLLSYLETPSPENKENVRPQNLELLNISYKKRSLEDYE